MRRREVIQAMLAAALLPAGSAFAAGTVTLGRPSRFRADTVAELARRLAAAPFQAPDTALPGALGQADYDGYRDIRFRPERALWAGDGVPFRAHLFHRGFLFREKVDVYVVDDGRATPLAFSPDLFDYGPQAPAFSADDLGFAGFRLHAPLNTPDYHDELCSFLGASYFRAVARGLNYGLSARGLAIGVGESTPEEFPRFRAFWLHRPRPDDATFELHALLDSPGVTGAYRFVIAPGDETVFEVDAQLFPRQTLDTIGIAPLTSMFFFDASDRAGYDDFRPAVHDSDGLGILTGDDEQVWRPLHNPSTVQHSVFVGDAPKGFGLMQRKRNPEDFLDLEARYELRPSAWVEPLDDWGPGGVQLVEIPTVDEYQDNIVAFWRPAEPLQAGQASRWRYRLHWCDAHSWKPELATVSETRTGAVPGQNGAARLIVIDWAGGPLATLGDDASIDVDVTDSDDRPHNVVAYRNPDTGGWRTSFEWPIPESGAGELRVRLRKGGDVVSETWSYRWVG